MMDPDTYRAWVEARVEDDAIECVAIATRSGQIVRWDSIEDFIEDIKAHQAGELPKPTGTLDESDAETVREFAYFIRRALHAITHWRIS